jgi:hypothetical protein
VALAFAILKVALSLPPLWFGSPVYAYDTNVNPAIAHLLIRESCSFL